MTSAVDDRALDALLLGARSHSKWLDRPLPANALERIYAILKCGPTSMNCSPARIHFCVSQPAKDRLAAHAMPSNQAKIKTAPAVAIIANEMKFYELLPRLFPPLAQMREVFAGNEALASANAMRNGTLQGAYFMIAARAIGLDVGAMSGFNNAAVDAEFFAGTTLKSNFLCAIGYGDAGALGPRMQRLEFDEACRVL